MRDIWRGAGARSHGLAHEWDSSTSMGPRHDVSRRPTGACAARAALATTWSSPFGTVRTAGIGHGGCAACFNLTSRHRGAWQRSEDQFPATNGGLCRDDLTLSCHGLVWIISQARAGSEGFRGLALGGFVGPAGRHVMILSEDAGLRL